MTRAFAAALALLLALPFSAAAGEKEDTKAADAARVLGEIMRIPETAVPEKMFLIDGSNHAFRVQFALPPMNASNGFPTRALYGFTTLFAKVLRVYRPDYVVVSFDKGRTFRHDLFPEYKGHRPDMPEDCPERLGPGYLEFLAFIWRTRHSARTAIRAIFDAPPPHLRLHRVRTLREARALIATLVGGAPPDRKNG